jgi:hypothetical protein
MQGPLAAAIPNWQASVSFVNRPPGAETVRVRLGSSRVGLMRRRRSRYVRFTSNSV